MSNSFEIWDHFFGQFQDLCEFVEMAVFEDATYLWPQYTLVLWYLLQILKVHALDYQNLLKY